MTSWNLSRLTAAALCVLAFLFVYEFVVIAGRFDPVLTAFAVVALVIAVFVARGRRWAPLLGAAWIALVLLMSLPFIIEDLSNPAALHPFLWQIVTFIVAVVGVAAGIGATMRGRRDGGRQRVVH